MEHNVLGEGAYGCVITPSLECDYDIDNDFYKGRVSKFMASKDAAEELREYGLIDTADPSKKFYLGLPKKCNVKNSVTNISAIKKCNYTKKRFKDLSKVKKSLDKFSLLIMPDGGLNLKQWSDGMFLENNTLANRKIVQKFWVEMHRCFLGLIVFQKHNILHHDIKVLNIVYSQAKNRANYIDFGFMSKRSKIIKNSKDSTNKKLGSAFWSWPLELMFVNRTEFMKYAELSSSEKRKFLNSLYTNIQYNRDTKDNFCKAFTVLLNIITKHNSDRVFSTLSNKFFNDFVNTYLLEIVPENYDAFLEKTVDTIDSYGLGLSLFIVLNNLKHLMDERIYDLMYDCFFHMFTASLKNRYSAEQSLTVYENILQEMGYSVKHHIVGDKLVSRKKSLKVSRMKSVAIDLLANTMDRKLEDSADK